MYVGFEIDSNSICGIKVDKIEYYKNLALSNHNHHKTIIEKKIKESFVFKSDGVIEVKPIEDTWFPNINCHIFLSHSHYDENIALFLAGFLKEKCDVDVFVDSCIWSYSNDLLKIIDEHYCKTRFGHYDYNLRNITTTHVHLILNMALTKMINCTECFMFMKTNNSIYNNKDVFIKRTESAWICDELLIASIIARRSKEVHRKEFRVEHSFSINESYQEFPKFIYDLSFMDLKSLTCDQLLEIAISFNEEYYGDGDISRAERFLDLLYKEMHEYYSLPDNFINWSQQREIFINR